MCSGLWNGHGRTFSKRALPFNCVAGLSSQSSVGDSASDRAGVTPVLNRALGASIDKPQLSPKCSVHDRPMKAWHAYSCYRYLCTARPVPCGAVAVVGGQLSTSRGSRPGSTKSWCVPVLRAGRVDLRVSSGRPSVCVNTYSHVFTESWNTESKYSIRSEPCRGEGRTTTETRVELRRLRHLVADQPP